MTRNRSTTLEMNWVCATCEREGSVVIPVLEHDRPYYIVCEDCNSGSGYGWCEKRQTGGQFIFDLAGHLASWDCPLCKAQHPLPADFYERPIPFKPTGDWVDPVRYAGKDIFDYVPQENRRAALKSAERSLIRLVVICLVILLGLLPLTILVGFIAHIPELIVLGGIAMWPMVLFFLGLLVLMPIPRVVANLHRARSRRS